MANKQTVKAQIYLISKYAYICIVFLLQVIYKLYIKNVVRQE